MPAIDIKTVHIAEPDAAWRHFFQQQLSVFGQRGRFYARGSELVDNIDSSACLIVVEAKLPDFSWPQLLEAIRKKESFSQIPYVLMSTSIDRDLVERGLGEGVQAVLHKQVLSPTEIIRFFSQYI